MGKAVLISIRPKWCNLIANGQKTVEIRKTHPKLETPFKCYIYCTKPKFPHDDHITLFNKQKCFYAGGLAIGEFACDWIEEYTYGDREGLYNISWNDLGASKLTIEELQAYGNGASIFGWHISGLVIYERPKELSEFTGLRKTKFGYAPVRVIRPPQSWCYVEELTTT